MGNSVQQTTDGGYILCGSAKSSREGEKDVYLIKTDTNGNELWSKTFGGDKHAEGFSVQQTTDGGYIICGWKGIYLIKTDANGNELWSKTFREGVGQSVQQTTDGGYILCGWGYFETGWDVCLIKTDSNGDELWSKSFGGDDDDGGLSVQQTTDGGYVIVGFFGIDKNTDSSSFQVDDVYLIYYNPLDNVNNYVNLNPIPSSYSFSTITNGCPSGFAGIFSFDAALTNDKKNRNITDLTIEISKLTNGNLLLTNRGLLFEGDWFSVASVNDYSDSILSSGELVYVPFDVCCKNRKPFGFYVDVLGVASDILD